MSDIIFAYQVPDTNWLNPAWRKAKKKELFEAEQKSNLIQLEAFFPNTTRKAIARKMGISHGYYRQLRKKYGLERRE